MDISVEDRAFELIGGHPGVDLANTLDWRFRDDGPEELLASYGDLLRFAEQSELVTAKQARQSPLFFDLTVSLSGLCGSGGAGGMPGTSRGRRRGPLCSSG